MIKPDIIYLEGFDHLTRGQIMEHDNAILHYVSDPRNENPFNVDVCLNIFEEYQVSTHYIIPRNGEILEMISPLKKAWHAGKSVYNGVTNINKNSIGIELIGNDDVDFTDEQYVAISKLCAWLHYKFGIPTKNIKGHQMVSDSKVRPDPKPDPGRHFDWIRFGYNLMNRINLDKNINTEEN